MLPPFSASAKMFILLFSSNYYCCIINYPGYPMKQQLFNYYVQRFCGLRICTGHSKDCSRFSGASAGKTHITRVT